MTCNNCIKVEYDMKLVETYADHGTGSKANCSIWGNLTKMEDGCYVVG